MNPWTQPMLDWLSIEQRDWDANMYRWPMTLREHSPMWDEDEDIVLSDDMYPSF